MNKYLNLEYLETFLQAAETGKLNVTADLTYQSHSTVSTQIKKLEAQTGMPLFVRSKNTLTLTKGGEVLVTYARKMLDMNQSVFHALSGSTWEGNILIGIPTDYAESFMENVYPKIEQELSEYQLSVEFSRSRQIRKKINERKVDIGMLAMEPQYEDEILLWEEKLCWMAARDFKFPTDTPLPIALFSDDCIFQTHALSCLRNSNVNFKVVFTSTSVDNIVTCVKCGNAISLLPISQLTPGLQIIPEGILSCPHTLKMGYTWNPHTDEFAIYTIANYFKKYFNT